MLAWISPRLLVSTLVLSLVPVVAEAQPRLQLDPPSLDFGTLAQRQTRSETVTLRNAGTEPVTITNVEATCGCTVPDLAVDTLAPGESTEMTVQFNSQEFQGRQIKYIKIHTDNPAQRVLDFQILAHVAVPLEMRPASSLIRFPTVRRGETAETQYTFSARSQETLEIEPSVWPQDWLDIDVKPAQEPSSVTVVFRIRPDAPAGTHREPLKLRTNVADAPVVDLEADVRVVDELVLNMDRINLRMARPGQALAAQVRVAPADPGTAFRLTGAEVDIPGLEAMVENADGEAVATISGEALAADHPFAKQARGRIAGTLIIQTDLASSPTLRVPVTYILRP